MKVYHSAYIVFSQHCHWGFGMAIVSKLREREIGRLDIGGFITYGVDASVAEVLKKMRETRVSAVLVESAGKLAGIFTERDALIKVTDNPDTWCRPISAMMTACPQTLPAQQPLSKAVFSPTSFRRIFTTCPPIPNAAPTPKKGPEMRSQIPYPSS